MRRLSKNSHEVADVDVTSFINLVVVLVPVLLMGMVLSRISVLDLKLPDLTASGSGDQTEPPAQLELVVRPSHFAINYPAGNQLKRIDKMADGKYDYPKLARYLHDIKRQLKEKGIDKRDVFLLSEKETDYQTLVSVMDALRSFKAVSGTSVVNVELFPEVSLGDAPVEDPARAENPAQINAEGASQ